jgi:uncharacterized protein (DUF169 family)
MDMKIKEKFITLWKRYFNGAELPIAFYYTDQPEGVEEPKPTSEHRCVLGDLSKVRSGKSLRLGADSIGCSGGKRYFGFAEWIMPNFEYFLSCGIPGKLEGERYKKSPELVREAMKKLPRLTAPARFIVFKRWDVLQEPDHPEVVIFFARPDVLSGLFTLSNFDESEPDGISAPFGAGCASIVQYPYLEKDSNRPRGVLGMFDVSARPYVPQETLTFALPRDKFIRMIDNMEESFLITNSWAKVHKRISKSEQGRNSSSGSLM